MAKVPEKYMLDVRLRSADQKDFEKIRDWTLDEDIASSQLSAHYILLDSLSLHELLKSNVNRVFMIERSNGEKIGYTILKHIDWKNKNAQLGVVVGKKSYWKKGYGMFAALKTLSIAFRELGLHRVYSTTSLGNRGAIDGHIEFGTIEGVYRQDIYINGKYHDIHVASLLSQEFEKLLRSNRIARRIVEA